MDKHLATVPQEPECPPPVGRPAPFEGRAGSAVVDDRRSDTGDAGPLEGGLQIGHTGPCRLVVLDQGQDQARIPGQDVSEVLVGSGQGSDGEAARPRAASDFSESVGQETSRMNLVISGRMFSRHFRPLKMP